MIDRKKIIFRNAIIDIKSTVLHLLEAVPQTCSVKKVFLENSQNSPENTCARVSILIKLQARAPVAASDLSQIILSLPDKTQLATMYLVIVLYRLVVTIK